MKQRALTHRHKAASKLTKDVAQDPVLNLFLNSIKDQAVFTVDPEGIITTWSDGCQCVYRYTAEQAIGQNFRMVYTDEDKERGHPADNLRMALEEGEYHEERERLQKGNEPFMAEVSIYPIKEKGSVAGFAKIVKDISERQRLQAELRRSNSDLESFCNSVAHDLRTPIRAIIAKCRIVQEDYTQGLPHETSAYLDTLVKSSVRLGRLVDDLLEFARLGRGNLKRQDVDMSAMATRIAEEVGPGCVHGTARINIQADVHADADPSMLEFVLRNLLENSCKFSETDVNVNVGMAVVNGESVFHVQDDGIGFDMAYAEALFEPFHRLHADDAYTGTGIGLANVKRIVERHGGHVWAESETGKGASFLFTL